MKINDVIARLEKWHEPFVREKTKDVIKLGDGNQECTGIVVTCYGSSEVIQKAIDLGCNLVITHESIFFGDEFELDGFIHNTALEKKQKLIQENKIVVYRDHDHIHGMGGGPHHEERFRDDYIYVGIMNELGWNDYVIKDKRKPLWYKIPETTVGQLADELLEKLNLNGVRIVGKENVSVSTVFIAEHCMGRGDQEKINQAVEADVIIPLEIVDWTMSGYVREASYFNENKAILEFGHFNFEELGMKYMVKWLPEAIGNEVPIHYIQASDPFTYHLRKEN